MRRYIEIPIEMFDDLQFPDFCPFTQVPQPGAHWKVRGKTRTRSVFSMLIPIPLPIFDSLWHSREYSFPIPAARKFVRTQQKIQRAIWLLIGLFVLWILFPLFVQVPPEIVAAAFLLWPVILLLSLWGRWRQRHVRIDYVGEEFVEIALSKKTYAEKFCQLNDLESKRKLINFRFQ